MFSHLCSESVNQPLEYVMYLFRLGVNEQRPGVKAEELDSLETVRKEIATLLDNQTDYIVRNDDVLVLVSQLAFKFKVPLVIVSDTPVGLKAGDAAPGIEIVNYEEWELARRARQSMDAANKRIQQDGPSLSFGKLINDDFLKTEVEDTESKESSESDEEHQNA